ncbi:39958_t:CDS:2 [Gigaspora margarita]|uniref:39958_t:CDS:1 n=1 Tax=Gigaspora margarita TaxID=4874 RepID=A0ABN7VC99_GIGMA|nr:39958_t:CDS:2 [Gigaspora margarita]
MHFEEFEIEEFVRIEGESSYALGRRFELFCCELLVRYFEEQGAIVTHMRIESTSGHCFGSERSSQLSMTPSVCVARGASGDGGRDIIVEMQEYRFVVQCREEADAFLTVIRRGNFDFGL